MKSEKAREYITNREFHQPLFEPNSHIVYDMHGNPIGSDVIESCYARRAVIIAEAELLETHVSIERAKEAFKLTCFHRCQSKCGISPTYNEELDRYDEMLSCNEYCSDCSELKKFMEKLKEVEK